MYDTIIIGMGPAGISAGIYAKRSKLNTLILEKSTPGGLLNKIKVIDNYPGFSNVSGPDLAFNMFNHINNIIGQMATCTYFYLSDTGIPLQPV